MFEKEAKEYSTSSKVDYVNNIAITLVQLAFKDGAEFGFNKANKWHDLRKDSNDLPVFETELLCQKYSGRCFVGYCKDNKFYSHETGKSYDVVRWLDIGVWWNIPQFEE